MDHLDLTDLLQIARRGLARVEVRDYGLLESALARPQATVFGEDAYRDVHEKAAALLHSLLSNHALVDGNKRLAWLACRVFYGLNGYTLQTSHNDAFDLVVRVADGTSVDVLSIGAELSGWAVST